MTQVVALIFQGVEGFILDLPAGAAGSHDIKGIFPGNGEVGGPAESGDLVILPDLPILQEVYQQVFV